MIETVPTTPARMTVARRTPEAEPVAPRATMLRLMNSHMTCEHRGASPIRPRLIGLQHRKVGTEQAFFWRGDDRTDAGSSWRNSTTR